MGARYEISPGMALRVGTMSGSVEVIAEEREDVEVDPADRHVESKSKHDLQILVVRSRSSRVTIRCPRGMDVGVGAMSGNVTLRGDMGSVKVGTVSGNIEVDLASGDVDVRSVSGHLSVRSCGGNCQMNTKSGKIIIGHVAKEARASTISGTVDVSTDGRGDVEVKSISGGVTIKVAQGRRPRARVRTLSGRFNCDCPQGSDFDIKASTLSGSVTITDE